MVRYVAECGSLHWSVVRNIRVNYSPVMRVSVCNERKKKEGEGERGGGGKKWERERARESMRQRVCVPLEIDWRRIHTKHKRNIHMNNNKTFA